MALNFGILDLDAPAKIAGSVYAGQQARQEQQDRNMLRQQQAEQIEIQRQNMLGLREDRLAQAQQRKSELARATESQQWLNKVAELWDPNIPLNSQTAAQGLQYALKSGDKNAIEMMQKTVQAFREEAQFNTEMGRFAPKAAPVAPAVSGALGSGTFGITPAPANALAPAAAPVAAAPTNALAGGYSRSQIEQMLVSPNARVRDMGKNLLGALPKEDSRYNVPGVGLVDAAGRVVISSVEKPAAPPASIAEFDRAKTDPGFMRFLEERAAAMRPPRPEPAPRTQQLTLSDGSLGIVNMDTGVITPSTLAGASVKGKPSATAEKTAIQRKQLGLDLDRAITELTDVIKEGGLIDQSTGSGAGRLVDLAAGFGGKAMPGAIAIGKLQPIADLALKMVPRFEGPQSNADTTSYKQAAGQLADATLPREIRKEAAKTVLRLMKSRKDQFASPEMAAEGVTLGESSAPSQPPAVVPGRAGGPAVVQGTGGFKYLGKESK